MQTATDGWTCRGSSPIRSPRCRARQVDAASPRLLSYSEPGRPRTTNRYLHGRISYRNYYRLYNARWIRWRNFSYGQRYWFNTTDFCLGGVVGGTVGLITMGVIDVGVGVANVAGAGASGPIVPILLIPVDVAALTATAQFYSILKESTRNSCNNVRLKWPWE